MANVKHTTDNGEILTTNCKRVATALKRFATFLNDYDRCYNDMLNNIKSATDNNTITLTDDRYNTITMTLTTNGNNDNYTLTIKHTHNAPKTIWCICNQDGTIKDFDDRKELFKYAYDNNLYGDFETIWIEEKELKEERFDYYETVDYEELDLYKIRTMLELDICDMKVNNTKDTESDTKDTNKDTNDNKTMQQTYNIKAYYDGKELTVPCDKYESRQYAVEYIKALYENHVVEYETLFFIYYGKHVETMTIENVLDVTDLIECNIDNINDGLKTNCYKKVRESFERLCCLIDDKHQCAVGFVTVGKTRFYTITKSEYEGRYNLTIGSNNWIQTPAEIARFLYYNTFSHEVVFKHYGTI